MLKSKKVSFGVGAVLVAAIGLGVVFTSAQDGIRSVETGESWLEQKGYTGIQGGETLQRGFNGCGPLVASRDYTATSPEGDTGPVTVCLSGLGPRFSAY